MPSGLKAWTRASRPPAWPLMWPRIASACWPPRPARCSWSAASRASGSARKRAWSAGYLAMAALVVIGIATTLIATEPAKSATAAIEHVAQARENPVARVAKAAYASFADFLTRDIGDRRSRVRRALQILRCIRRRHDGALRDRSRFLPQRLRRHRQRCRARGHPDRGFRRRRARPRLSAGHQPLDRRLPTDGFEPGVHLAGARSASTSGH